MTKRVFSYVRVSGPSQVSKDKEKEDKDGFPRQREAIQKFCDSKGWTIMRPFTEEAVSGDTEGAERPAFSEMLDFIGVEVDTVVVETMGRLGRDVFVLELIFREARKAGMKIYAADSGQEIVNAEGDPTRKFIQQILAAAAQWEKAALVKKLRHARDRIRAETGRCGGPLPYELTAHGASVARMIFESHLGGHSYAQICKWLNGRNIPSTKGGPWGISSVHVICKRYKYLNLKNHPQTPVPYLANFPDSPSSHV